MTLAVTAPDNLFTSPPPEVPQHLPSRQAPAPNIREQSMALKRAIDTAYIVLGKNLYHIFHRRLYLEWGHETFDDYLETELGRSRSVGDRLRRMWVKFVKELGLQPDQLEGIGYSRALVLLPVISSVTAQDWLHKARTLTWRDLNEAVADAKRPPKAHTDALIANGIPLVRHEPLDGASIIADKTDEDQSDSSESAQSGVADLGGGGNPAPRPSGHGCDPDRRPPAPQVHQGHLDDVRKTVSYRLRSDQLLIWNAALDEVRRAKDIEVSPGEAVAHVATEFLASRLAKENAPASKVAFYLRAFERVFGGRFVWLKTGEAADALLQALQAHPELFQDGTSAHQPYQHQEIPHDEARTDHADGHASDESHDTLL